MAAVSEAEKRAKIDDTYELKVGDRVIVDKDKKGQIRWVGEDRVLGVGMYYGVRLTEARGTCNGTFKDVKFFWCPDNCGVIIQRTRIKFLYTGEEYDFMGETKPVDPAIAKIQEKRKEIKRMKKKFKEMDTSGDLQLDVKEFAKLCTGPEGLFPTMTQAEVKKLFDEIDGTKSGSISFAEFDAWIKGLGGLVSMEQDDFLELLKKFQSMDKDGDKKITLEEFSGAACTLFPTLSKKQVESLFGEIDESGDGSITFDEYETWAREQ